MTRMHLSMVMYGMRIKVTMVTTTGAKSNAMKMKKATYICM